MESSSSPCSICLESMLPSEDVFVLPCRQCKYNFCTKCIKTFIRASKDDYQVASDGSRQVKVHVACPQCRTEYPMEISEVLLLRRAHTLATTIMDDDGNMLGDSQLTASQLSMKRDFLSKATKQKVESSHLLYLKVMEGCLPCEATEDAKKLWTKFFDGIDDDGSPGGEAYESDGLETPKGSFDETFDDTLFQGLEDCMMVDEKLFLSQLMTSGEASKLANAAMILNGVLKLSSTSQAALTRLSFDQVKSKTNADQIAKMKTMFPLPSHMPGYFIIPVFTSRQNFLMLADEAWDGSITPPAKSKRVFELVYGKRYQRPKQPRSVVVVTGVRGPAGRVGLRKGDVVTHVNDMEWTGTAAELQEYIYNLHGNHPEDNISITVNASPETSAFLKVRHEMMEESRQELI